MQIEELGSEHEHDRAQRTHGHIPESLGGPGERGTIFVLERDRQSVAVPEQSHELLQLRAVVLIRGGELGSDSGEIGEDEWVLLGDTLQQYLPFYIPGTNHSSVGGTFDCEPTTSVGSVDHIHRTDQESRLQVLGPRIRALRTRDDEVSESRMKLRWMSGADFLSFLFLRLFESVARSCTAKTNTQQLGNFETEQECN